MQCIEFPLKGMEFDAVHRIPVERKGLSMGIRCSASNSIPFNGNSMQCIEFQRSTLLYIGKVKVDLTIYRILKIKLVFLSY